MNDTIKSIATIMKDLDGILLFPHINMDGDALGSCTALCLALRSMGKKAYVMINEPVPKNLDFLECGCCTDDDSLLDDVQLSLMVDCNGINRITGREKAWERGRLKGCIDHHATKAKEIRYDFARIEPKAAAAATLPSQCGRDTPRNGPMPDTKSGRRRHSSAPPAGPALSKDRCGPRRRCSRK